MNWPLFPIKRVIKRTQYGLSIAADPHGSIPIVGMKDIQDGRVTVNSTMCVGLSESQAEGYRLKKGDILLNRTNSPALVGKAGIVQRNENAVFASHLVRIEIDNTLADSAFVNHYINSEVGQRQMKTLSTRAISQANINPTIFCRNFLIHLPPIYHQRVIARLLSAWDTAIVMSSRLVELRQRQKAGLTNIISTFSEKERRLGEFLISKARGVPKPDEPYWALGIRSHGKGTFQRFVDDPQSVDMEQLFSVRENDLIVNITFAWEGAVAIVGSKDESCLVSHRFPTYEFDRSVAIPEFVRHVVNRKQFFNQLSMVSPGGAGRNRVLNKRAFLNLTLRLPAVSDQIQFALLLGSLDKIIELENDRLQRLKDQKRGLMQKLLTGEWTVKVDEPEVSP